MNRNQSDYLQTRNRTSNNLKFLNSDKIMNKEVNSSTVFFFFTNTTLLNGIVGTTRNEGIQDVSLLVESKIDEQRGYLSMMIKE